MENEQILKPHETIARIVLKDYADRIIPERHERIVSEVDKLLALLSAEQKIVIEYLYGFHGKKYSMPQVGKMLSKKLNDIHCIKEDAIRWMSHPNQSFGLYMALHDDQL
ncbi:MAG: hypothetical protein MJ105_07465 [Lachnospiraceae bacterium]|nr:hypothetical protein [Lachnospiraceae bacterium]